VNPTGIVDLMTMVASGAVVRTSVITDSTEDVSKKLVTSS
jgi:hypothetical protein